MMENMKENKLRCVAQRVLVLFNEGDCCAEDPLCGFRKGRCAERRSAPLNTRSRFLQFQGRRSAKVQMR